MNILLIHNRYQIPGGEDEVVQSEKTMLERSGHKAVLYERSNSEIEPLSFPEKMRFVLGDMVWSERSCRDVREIIQREKIDLAHIHNTFLVVSPSVYQTCREEHIPVVQTLHNYRFLCPNGLFFRNGRVCTDCLTNGRQAAVLNRCWRNSFGASWAMARAVDAYHSRGILNNDVSQYIALSQFSRRQFTENGFPEGKISVKPNFLNTDPGAGRDKDDCAVFVGGLFAYKGVATLVKAWQNISGLRLKMIGDGPLLEELRKSGGPNVEFLGRKPFAETLDCLRRARFLVLPSECYENFPRVIVEAFACGVPVLGSDAGVIPELVRDGETGMVFRSGDPRSLAEKAGRMINDKELCSRMGQAARKEFEAKYTPKRNYQELMAIYQKSIETFQAGERA